MPSKSVGLVLLTLLLGGVAPRAEGQLLSRFPVSLEGRIGSGVPTGDFATRDPGIAAGPGLAFAVGGVLEVVPLLGVYAQVQQARFACEECADVGLEESAQGAGVEAGAELRVPYGFRGVRPWLRGGVLRSTLRLSSAGGSMTSERGAGFAAGAGLRIPALGAVLTPGVRYQSYPARFQFTSLGESRSVDVTHFTVDLGLLLPL